MLETNDSGAPEMLAPAEVKSTARGQKVVSFSDNSLLDALQTPAKVATSYEEVPFIPSAGAAGIIQVISDQLSSVIHRGKTALLEKSGVGFLVPGFDAFSIRELALEVELAIALCNLASGDPRLPAEERIAAIKFVAELEEFQYCFVGIDVDSIGRSDASFLIPAFEKFKQICMQSELELFMSLQGTKSLAS